MRISAFMENIGQAARDAGIPMQTLLAQLWFIKDPAEALENIRAQRAKEKGGEERGE